MKRIWIAAVLLVILAGLCTAEQYYTKSAHDSIVQMATEAKRDKKEINALKLYWREHNDTLYAMSNHDALDGLAAAIEALDPESDDFEEQLNEIIAMTKVYYENQRSTFSNIL